ncbi:MAG: WecB/TagA/CpsF family glycosyltransferase [Candidatus Omnitrophica bacterium]|nr:WecB/TagA/CpsF family glycosyltransferase [Candidatus Omnitrophota bacterium]
MDTVQIPEVIDIARAWIEKKENGNYIVISNANDVVISQKDEKVKEAINKSSLSVPDGISLVIMSRLYGHPLKQRVYGPDLMQEFLNLEKGKSCSHFFYGASHNTLTKLIERVKRDYPNAIIAGYYSPPFRPLKDVERQEIIYNINKARPDILWVGLGCPKQQLWMHENRQSLKVPVMVGVGAAFDFLAGTKPQAPRWIRDNGFEWLYRLLSEPGRLWRRYLIGNCIFIFLALKDIFHKKLFKSH